MASQIFKNTVPKELLKKFLEDNSISKGNKFVFSKVCFKKSQLKNTIHPLLEKIKPYYFPSKQFYITRSDNYKNFITIIRQICKFHNIGFVSNIKYNKSKYEINYSIFFPEQSTDT
jgi:hypothetical protein